MRKVYLLLLIILLFSPLSNIGAQEVDILWQGETYSPPFYKGRDLWSRQSNITLVAVPQGLGNPANLNYRWSRNTVVLGSLSGIGRNFLSLEDSVISRPQTIRVSIFAGETRLATDVIQIVPVSPSLVIYESNPLYGFMFHKKVSETYPLGNREVTFTAFPFFFSVADRSGSDIEYQWGSNAGDVITTNSATYRAPDQTSGFARIQVRSKSEDKILQSAGEGFLIQFGEEDKEQNDE